MIAPTPIVLVQIDKDSRLSVLQTDEVQVAFVDRRVDDFGLTLLPRLNQIEQIYASVLSLKLLSETEDSGGTAAEAIRRLKNYDVIVTTHNSKQEA